MKNILTIAIGLLFPILIQAQPNNLSKADKVYGLSKFWQEVNYNFVYLNKVDRKMWDSTYKELITVVQETQNDYEYYRELQKFCALLQDGHTNINMPDDDGFATMTTMFGDYRLFLQNIEGKAIVVRVNPSKKDEIPPGSEITKVNGLPTKTYMERFVTPYISSSTDHVLADNSIYNLLQGPVGSTFQVTIKTPNGKTLERALTHSRTENTEVYPPFEEEGHLLDFKWYDNDIAYMALNSFDDAKIDTLFLEKLPELKKAKRLIVDLRNNGGGSTGIGSYILQYLTRDSSLYGSKWTTRMHLPSFKAWGRYYKPEDTVGNEWARKALLSYQDNYFYDTDYQPYMISLPEEERISIPTVILIGHGTASAAEDFLILADKQWHMTKIGQPSYGSTGQPYLFELPGGGMARVCTKKDTYPDGREFVGYGVMPDIVVEPTLKDYLENKDGALQKALEYLSDK